VEQERPNRTRFVPSFVLHQWSNSRPYILKSWIRIRIYLTFFVWIYIFRLVGALRKAMSICLLVFTQQLGSQWMDFHEILGFFENLSGKFKFHWNLTKTTYTLHENQNTFLIISRSGLLKMGNRLDKSCRENRNTFHFQKYFRISCCSWGNVEKYCRLGQATDDNMVQCMLLACRISRLRREYGHTLRISNTYCFCTARTVTPTRLNVTLYVHCLSCLFYTYLYFWLLGSWHNAIGMVWVSARIVWERVFWGFCG
jgi:hypothetical protein